MLQTSRSGIQKGAKIMLFIGLLFLNVHSTGASKNKGKNHFHKDIRAIRNNFISV